MPDHKLVIRRLPPSMNEFDFLQQVSPLPDHDYFCFFESNSGLGPHSFSRAYINFLDSNDMSLFKERFDNYIFSDKDGNEYPAVVEQPLWHKSHKSGPFYKASTVISADDTSQKSIKLDNSIESDPDFIEFIDKLQAQKNKTQSSPIQTLESNLDELTSPSIIKPTSASNNNNSSSMNKTKVSTPLINFVNLNRSLKNSSSNKKSR